MKKYLLGIFLVALLAFMLASCVPQDHPPAVSFVTPSGVNAKTIADGGTYGPALYTFQWRATDIDKKDVVTTQFVLTHAGTDLIKVPAGISGQATFTFTKPGTYTAMVVATDKKGLSSSDKIDFTITTDTNIEFTSKSLFGFEYINLSWKSKNADKAHIYQYNIDGSNWTTVSSTPATEVALQFIPESAGGSIPDGNHYLFVRVADEGVNLETAPQAVFPFTVDTTPPTVYLINSDRNIKNYDNVYLPNGDSNPEGRYDLIQFGVIPGLTKIQSIKIRFYEFASAKATDGSIYSKRFRLGLASSQGNHVFDQWTVTSTDGTLYNAETQPWFGLDTYYVNKYGSDYILFNDNTVTLWGADGKYYAKNLFKLNTQYAMYIDMVDEAGNESGAYVTFALKERYDSDSKPVVYMDSSSATVTKGSDITFKVETKNVKSYCESGGTIVGADFSFQYGLQYAQIPVVITSTATLSTDDISVGFTNFMPGEEDLNACSKVQLDPNTVLVELYKGFVNGTDETTSATDLLSSITVSVPSDVASDTVYRAFIGYEGYFSNYPFYKGHLPNPTFRNPANQPIDGINTYDTPSAMVVANPTESK
jgi:hypothetical protein